LLLKTVNWNGAIGFVQTLERPFFVTFLEKNEEG